MSNISDRQFSDLCRFIQDLPAYRRKQLAIICISSALGHESVKSIAKTMVTLSEFELELAKKEMAKTGVCDE